MRDYLESHYVRADGDLYVLGFKEAPTRRAPRTRTIDVIREGDYFIQRSGPPALLRRARASDLLIDGRPLEAARIPLEARSYEITLKPDSAGYRISPMPAAFFVSGPSRLHYSMMFEYK